MFRDGPSPVSRGGVPCGQIGASAEASALIGQSRAIAELRRRIEVLAPTDSSVLITGETGTGKGLVARLLHVQSSRVNRPFVHVDCAVLSESVIESELFGHERGSFTGAHERRRGRFELAERGTIFLDEIAELEPRMQAKLLRVLQDREYERVGGTSTLKMTARVIAATNQNPEAAVEAGHFRSDLYFRLRVMALFIPPLRERREDIPMLLEHWVRKVARERRIVVPPISKSFLDVLAGHRWPGNVRELYNYLECSLIFFHEGPLEANHAHDLLEISEACRAGPAGAQLNPTLVRQAQKPYERDRIAMTLIETGGNVSRAARRLQMPRSTLRYHIRTQGLEGLLPGD